LTIPPSSNLAIARMVPGSVDVEILVLDAQNEAPLAGAEISYFDTVANAGERPFGRTDADGVAANALAPGSYNLRIAKEGYDEVRQGHEVASGQNALVIRLSPQQQR
jgi:hypothetical protein